jgi:hypothetical protein
MKKLLTTGRKEIGQSKRQKKSECLLIMPPNFPAEFFFFWKRGLFIF